MRIRRIVEVGAGGAGFSLAMWGSGATSPVPSDGGKGRYAEMIRGIARLRAPYPRRYTWIDGGPWGTAWSFVLGPRGADVVEALERLIPGSYAVMVHSRPDNIAERIAHWFWLQSHSVNGIAVWWDRHTGAWVSAARKGRSGRPRENVTWTSPARERGSSRRRSGVSTGSVIAGRIRFLRELAADLEVDVRVDDVGASPILDVGPDDLVFIDPPYVGRQGFALDLPRAEVIRLANGARERGAPVVVSEGRPIDELVDAGGWWATEMPSRTRCREWVMTSFRPDQVPQLQSLLPFVAAMPARRGKLRPLRSQVDRIPSRPRGVITAAVEQVSLFPGALRVGSDPRVALDTPNT